MRSYEPPSGGSWVDGHARPCQWCHDPAKATQRIILANPVYLKGVLVKRPCEADICGDCRGLSPQLHPAARTAREYLAAKGKSKSYWRAVRSRENRARQGRLF